MKLRLPIVVSMILVMAMSVLGAVPQLINAQGKLTDAQGQPLSDDNYSITFTIYDAASGGNIKWTETNPLVNVVDGQFNVLLGSVSPIHDSVFAGEERYLAIKVGLDPEMTPRSRLVSVGYSQRVATIDRSSGGTLNGRLEIVDPLDQLRLSNTAGGPGSLWRVVSNGQLRFDGNLAGGDFESGFEAPLQLYPTGSASISRDLDLGGQLIGGIPAKGGTFTVHTNGEAVVINRLNSDEAGSRWRIAATGASLRFDGSDVGSDFSTKFKSPLAMFPDGSVKTYSGLTVGATIVGGIPSAGGDLIVNGNTSTRVLEITGGSDLAEPFQINNGNSIPKGSVVVIDPANPGKLMLSDRSYDKRVAGIVSGAGGVQPGMTMQQDGVFTGGVNVALTGRVYALATAANGIIEPGDLLTTSEIPGHLMKAADESRCHGTVVGKAMSRLESGEGLVLVLVNLQ